MTPLNWNSDKTHEVYCPKCKESSVVPLDIKKCLTCETHLITVVRSMMTGEPIKSDDKKWE